MAEVGRPTKREVTNRKIAEAVTKLDDETVKKLEEVFALDGTVEEACFYAGISRQTYYNWVKEKPELLDRFEALRQRPFLKARQTIVKALDNPDHAFKYMTKKKKAEFGDALDLTTQGDRITNNAEVEAKAKAFDEWFKQHTK